VADDAFTPRPDDRFTFGLWTVGNRGRDPFGHEVRPILDPVDKGRRFAADPDIAEALDVARVAALHEQTAPDGFSSAALSDIRKASYDLVALGARGYGHERLDQLVTELLLGTR
jgi:hypothetical protein